ncbi:MAG: hypothetical protein ABI346_03570 [Candidatus Baltobacteraceae bacterium]
MPGALVRRVLVVAVALVVGLTVAHRLLVEPGIVGLFHDWTLPPFGSQNLGVARGVFDGWTNGGLGGPVGYPTEYPMIFAFALVSWLGLPADVLSKAVVVAVPAIALLAGYSLARVLGMRVVPALLCGAFYALNPVVLNKLVAGQLAYLFGYAFLPTVVAAFLPSIRRVSVARAVLAGGLAAIAGFEIQLGILAIAALFVCTLTAGKRPARRRWGLLAVALATAAVIELPTLIGASANYASFGARAEFNPIDLGWFYRNSVALEDALRLVGYVVGYDRIAAAHVPGWWLAAGVVAAAAIGGLVVAPRRVGVVAMGMLALVLALVAGLHSPFASIVGWAFLHVPLAQAFRELYHLMAVVALIYAIGIGYAFDWRANSPRIDALLVAVRPALAFTLVLFFVPLLSGNAEGQISAHDYVGGLAATYHRLEGSDRRVAWFPLDQPLAYRGKGAGIDPLGETPGGSLWDYSPEWPLTAVIDSARSEDWRGTRAEMAALSVGNVVDRRHFRSVLAAYVPGGESQHYFLERHLTVPALGPPTSRSATAPSYAIPGLPSVYSAGTAALIPRRLDVAGTLAGLDAAPFAFGTVLPARLPYAVVTDPADELDEALAGRGWSLPLRPITTDAGGGFIPAGGWWWERPGLGDLPHGVLAFGSQMIDVPVSRSLSDAELILSWLATPVGGRLLVKIDSLGWSSQFATTAPYPQWRSRAFHVGSVPAGTVVHVIAEDDGITVVRDVRAAQRSEVSGAKRAFARLLRGARTVVRWLPSERAFAHGRSGRTDVLWRARFGREYRLRVAYSAWTAGSLKVLGPSGYLVAYAHLAAGKHVATLAFDGIQGALTLDPTNAVVRSWSFDDRPLRSWEPVRRALSGALAAGVLAGQTSGTSGTVRAPRAIVVANGAFDPHWRSSDPAAVHLPTALGTNAWIDGLPPAQARIGDSQTTLFRAAFVVGTGVLVWALVFGGIGSVRERQTAIVAETERSVLPSRVRAIAGPSVARIARVWREHFAWVTVGTGVALGLLAIHRLIFQPGVVDLERDWAIPATAGQFFTYARQVWDGFQLDGLGLPVVYPAEYPYAFLKGLVGACGVPAGMLSKGIVAAGPALAFIGAVFLARTLGFRRAAAFAGAFIYALGPVMLNKIVAGQQTFALGLGLTPFAIALMVRAVGSGRVVRGGAAAGAALALVAIQIQLGLLVGLMCALAALAFGVASLRVRLGTLAVAVATALLVQAPVALGFALNLHALVATRATFRTDVGWLASNSVRLADGVRLAGYPTHYESLAVGTWPGAWVLCGYVVAFVAAIGFLLTARLRWFGLLVAAPCLLLTMGVYSPLATQIEWSFRHLIVMQVFVELYDVLTPVALIVALGVSAFWSHGFLQRMPRRVLVVIAFALVGYGWPLATGDAGGQLHAYPFDRPMAAAYEHVRASDRRTVWFPMDQPLAYDGSGRGIDPMWTTASGSLWELALRWPLTAVDMSAHAHDWPTVRAELAALSVGYAVRRPRFTSLLYRFLLGAGRHEYLEPSLDVPALSADSITTADGIGIDRLAQVLGTAYGADGFAVVPDRLTAATSLRTTGFVPVPFGTKRPPGLPYVVVRDLADNADEMLAEARIPPLAPPTNSVFPQGGFALLQSAWWYAPDLADAASAGAFALGPAQATTVVARGCRKCIVEVGWIATPFGGRFRVRLGHGPWSQAIATAGSGFSWRSALLPSGSASAGTRLTVRALDATAGVVLRNVRVVDASVVSRARNAYAALLGHARAVDASSAQESAFGLERSGIGSVLSATGLGRDYRLRLHYRSRRETRIGVLDSYGNLLGATHLPRGSGVATLWFEGSGTPVSLSPSLAVYAGWKLESRARRGLVGPPPAVARVRSRPPSELAALPMSALLPAGRRVVVWNRLFGPFWATSDDSATHVETSVGTNAWVRDPKRSLRIFDWETPYFHLAYGTGCLVLALGLAALVVELARPRRLQP